MRVRCQRRVGKWARAAAAAATVALVVVACEEDEESRPPLVGDCNDPACVEARQGVPVTVIGVIPDVPGGDAGAGGAGGGGGMPPPSVGTLGGTVFEIVATDLQTRQNLSGQVEVRAPSASGGAADPVIANTDSSGNFRLDGILASPVTWVGAGNFRNPPIEPYMDTLQAVDATSGQFVNLAVARRDAVRDAVSIAFMGDSLDFDPGLAHLALRFVRSNGVPIAGVHISVPSPEQVPTAYDAGDAFTSALEATSERGMALLVNMPAAAYPGVITTVVAELDGVQLSLEVQLAAGALTNVSAVVPEQP
jgi:hypothetical protein